MPSDRPTVTIHLADHAPLVRVIRAMNEFIQDALEIPGVREKLEPKAQKLLKDFQVWENRGKPIRARRKQP